MYGEVDDAALWEVTEEKNDLGEIVGKTKEKVDSFPARKTRLSADRRYESNRDTGIVEDRLYVDYNKVNTGINRQDYLIEYPEISEGDTEEYFPDNNVFKIESVDNVDDLDKRYQIDLLRTD